MLMEIYMTPRGRAVFEHIDAVNDGRFTPSMFYYVRWVGLPSDYYESMKEVNNSGRRHPE